jgi:hypothetical protein
MNPIIKAGEFSMAIEDMIEISDELDVPISVPVPMYEPYVPIKKQDPFQMLLDNIPSKPSPSSKTETYIKERKELLELPKSTTNGKEKEKEQEKAEPTKEELKPIKAYNLLDLQMLARLHKIDTQKEGKSGKKVNKTKEEMYYEIKEKLDK